MVEFSWEEKRQDLLDGIAALPSSLRKEALEVFEVLKPIKPQRSHSLPPAGRPIETDYFVVQFDEKTGAITRLRNKATGREWAGERNAIGLLTYQTLSAGRLCALPGQLSDNESRLGTKGFWQAKY